MQAYREAYWVMQQGAGGLGNKNNNNRSRASSDDKTKYANLPNNINKECG